MCKTSTEVLNINFSESQTGVKGRKPRVSIQLTMRRWAVIGAHTSKHIERAVTSSSPSPLKTAHHLSLTPAARVQAAQLQEPAGTPAKSENMIEMSTLAKKNNANHSPNLSLRVGHST